MSVIHHAFFRLQKTFQVLKVQKNVKMNLFLNIIVSYLRKKNKYPRKKIWRWFYLFLSLFKKKEEWKPKCYGTCGEELWRREFICGCRKNIWNLKWLCELRIYLLTWCVDPRNLSRNTHNTISMSCILYSYLKGKKKKIVHYLKGKKKKKHPLFKRKEEKNVQVFRGGKKLVRNYLWTWKIKIQSNCKFVCLCIFRLCKVNQGLRK